MGSYYIMCLLMPCAMVRKQNSETNSICLHASAVMININPCPAELIKMPHPLLIVSQPDSLIQIVDINSHSEWQTVQIQMSWLLQKPTDLDLHCLQRQGISGFSRTRVKRQGSVRKMVIVTNLRGLVQNTFTQKNKN